MYVQGLRLGYLHSSPELLEPCKALAVDHPSVLLQYSLAELMSTGAWERQVAIQCTEYRERMEVLCKGIEEHCEGLVRVIKPKGGFFLWIELLVSTVRAERTNDTWPMQAVPAHRSTCLYSLSLCVS